MGVRDVVYPHQVSYLDVGDTDAQVCYDAATAVAHVSEPFFEILKDALGAMEGQEDEVDDGHCILAQPLCSAHKKPTKRKK